MELPFFSIITVAFNAEDTIEETIRSVLSQTFTDYEIIVKDGVSKDDTLKRIPKDLRIQTISCPDSGIYDAMNQAIREAKGQYLCFLNCGDTFFDDGVLANIHTRILQEEKREVFYYGNYETNGQFTQTPAVTTAASLIRNPLCHQTMFIPRTLFETLGLYRADFRILADYEFTAHAFHEKIPFVNTGITVCRYLGGGISTQKKQKAVIKKEYDIVRKTYFSSAQRLRFHLTHILTFPRLRALLASDKAPAWLSGIYKKIANRAKKG